MNCLRCSRDAASSARGTPGGENFLIGGTYEDVWSLEITLVAGTTEYGEDLRHWVNDGLMVVFFLGYIVLRCLLRPSDGPPAAARVDARGYRDRLDQAPACLNILEFLDPVRARLMLFNDTSHYSEKPREATHSLSKWWDER